MSPEQQPLELSERHVELPVINPTRNGRPYHFVWAACTAAAAPTISGSDHSSAAPPQGIVKVDVTSGGERERFWVCPEPHQFVGEPCFVPRRRSAATREGTVEEDDGYLVDITSGWKDPGFPITAHTYASSEDGAGKLLVGFFLRKTRRRPLHNKISVIISWCSFGRGGGYTRNRTPPKFGDIPKLTLQATSR